MDEHTWAHGVDERSRTNAHGRARTNLDTHWHGALAFLGTAPWHALAQARANLGTPWHERGHGQDLADSLARARHEARLRKRLNIYYRERCDLSPWGGIGEVARTLEHALGAMPRHDPWTNHGVGHPPEPVGLDRAPASTRSAWARPGTIKQPLSCRETWATSFVAWLDQVKTVPSG
ncbi:hypothetical protein Syun_011537 [Stephania yunnanensis]|uniref:Uncharacterized protein n=1 Tax=Stephania yunnanensis TaxID=152371 RepID=A0AAP0JXQ0_9MAGN